MKVKCALGFHEWTKDCEKCAICGKNRADAHPWDGCKCSTCGKTRDLGHTWDGCKCSTCGKIRDQGHQWSKDCEKCAICATKRADAHAWGGCKCSTCGKTRDEGHSWDRCKCSTCGQTRDEGHIWGGCICSVCGKNRPKARTYVSNERGWDGCTGHDWSKGFKECSKCGESGYEVCVEAIRRTRLSDPGKYVNTEDEESLRANPRTYHEIIELFLKLGMDPRQNYWTDGYVKTSGLFNYPGAKGEGPDEARPLIGAISYDCVDVIMMMEASGVSMKAPCAGRSLFEHAERYNSKRVKAYLFEKTQNVTISKNPAAVPSLSSDLNTSIQRWKSSAEPQEWVKKHLNGWNHNDWLSLLEMLRKSEYWPMDQTDLGRHLEELRVQLLKNQPKEALVKKLTLGNSTERYMATLEIERLRDPFFIPHLQRALERDSDSGVYQNAACALGKIGTNDAGDMLISYLRKNYSAIQGYSEIELRFAAAAEALGHTKHPEAKSVLTKILEDGKNQNSMIARGAQSGLHACKASS
jgi:hypothetical protein